MIKQLKLASGLVLLALLTFMGVIHPASAQTGNPVDIAQALANAQNANDVAAMHALIAPQAQFVNDPDIQGGTEGREEWIADNTGPNRPHVAPSNIRQTAPDTVTADAVLSGGDIPPQLPHPFLVHVTFTIANGQITHAVIITDAQTRQDMQSLLGPPPSDGQTRTPVQVVLALADAQNQNDAAGMRALLSPDASVVNDPMFGGVENREQFIADNTGSNNSYVAASNVQQTAPDTVTADAVLSGGQIPAQLPHPFLVHVVFTVVNGQATHAVVNVDAQTRKDLEALGPPPGMPTTGQPGEWLVPGALALAALGLAIAGLTLRVRGAAR